MSRFSGPPVLFALFVAGCASATHTVAPYDRDPGEAADLAWMARGICSMQRGEVPDREFRSDGCSCFPDGDWVDCCVIHDIAYWCGGTEEDRRRADEQLGACVRATGRSTLGSSMALGVRIGGVPWLPFPWRWGYGWDFPDGYTDPVAPSAPPPAAASGPGDSR